MKIILILLTLILLLTSCGLPEQTEVETTTAETESDTEPVYATTASEESPDAKVDKSKYPQITNLPALYIDLDDNVMLGHINKQDYVWGSYTLVGDDTITDIYEKPLEMKGRGNYSWSFPKKPYTLRLDKKADILGLGAAKRWVLVTTYSDKTLMRNFLTMTLAYDIGAEFSPECRYVDLIVNGEYQGPYVLTEKIQIHENRVDIDSSKYGLFEIEMEYRHSGNCHYCIILPSGVHMMFIDPDEDDTSKDELDKKFIEYKSFMTTADIALTKGYDEYSKYIDVDSFIDWYIVNEFVKNYDSNFTTSCYCFINNDGLLTMGPVWDYDTCYGNQIVETCVDPNGYHVRKAPWYTILRGDDTFNEMLYKRWTELRNDGVFDDFVQSITDTAEYISESEKLDRKIWPDALKSRDLRGKMSLFTYQEELDYLINWVERRITWLDTQWYKN